MNEKIDSVPTPETEKSGFYEIDDIARYVIKVFEQTVSPDRQLNTREVIPIVQAEVANIQEKLPPQSTVSTDYDRACPPQKYLKSRPGTFCVYH